MENEVRSKLNQQDAELKHLSSRISKLEKQLKQEKKEREKFIKSLRLFLQRIKKDLTGIF